MSVWDLQKRRDLQKRIDPPNKIEDLTETERLMLPFDYGEDIGPDYEMLDIVQECFAKLSDKEQKILYSIFYDGQTYEKLAESMGTKAKSHAWRSTRRALNNLKKELFKNPRFKEKWDERNK